MHPLYLSIQGTCRSTRNSPTAIAFSAVDPLVIAGPRIGEHAIRRAVAYALYGGSGCGEQQLPDADSLRTRVTFVFWAHGHAWEVSRSGARRAGDAARDTACSLRRMGDADQTGSVLEGARQVNRRIARPSASAVRSTCLGSTASPASSSSRVLASLKLTRAAAAAVMRVAAGDNVVSSMPRVRSRGQNPVRQDSQW